MNEKYNVSSSPHIRDKVTSSNIMLYVVIALLPATFFGIWNFRHENAWILVVVTTAAAVLSEYLYEKLMHKPITINDFSAVVTGLLLALNLPPTLPWWMPAPGDPAAACSPRPAPLAAYSRPADGTDRPPPGRSTLPFSGAATAKRPHFSAAPDFPGKEQGFGGTLLGKRRKVFVLPGGRDAQTGPVPISASAPAPRPDSKLFRR